MRLSIVLFVIFAFVAGKAYNYTDVIIIIFSSLLLLLIMFYWKIEEFIKRIKK